MSARDEAIEAMATALETMVPWDRFDVMVVKLQVETALDAIPSSVLARLVVDRGGMEQVGWQRAPQQDETIHRLARTPDDAKRRGERAVYRLTEETP